MKNTMYIVVFLSVLQSFAQKSKTSYIRYTYYDYLLNDEFESHLILDNNTSSYHIELVKKYKNTKTIRNGNISIGGVDDKYVFKNFKTNKLTSVLSFEADNLFGVSENMPEFDWLLSNTFKVIDGYNCQKATTSFRGRDYEAWFTNKIAISNGPWKFHGLPGLILQVADKTGNYQWTVTQIKIPSNYKIEKTANDFKSIDLTDYLKLVAEEMNQTRARVRSLLPEGAIVKVPKNSRRGIELIFEWETPDNNPKKN